MASLVSIANAALDKVGASPITSFTQGTKNANFINRRYAELRDSLLETHPWNWAVKSVKLALLADTPVVKFDYAYQLPADFIRVVSVHDSDQGGSVVDHKIRDNRIEAVSSQAWLIYISRVTDPNIMSPLFRNALASLIAIEAATAITESRTLREDMVKQHGKDLRRARSADSISDLPDRMPPGSWFTARSGRIGVRRWGN